MTKYKITLNNLESLYQFINTLPNKLSQAYINPNEIECEFDHTTPDEELEFKRQISKRLLVIDDNSTTDNIYRFMDQVLGDHLFCSITASITKTNIGTEFVDVFPDFYDSMPIAIDTKGYTKLGIVLLWNKNGGTGTHTARLVNHADPSKVFVSGNIISGRNKNYDIEITNDFENFRGELRLQAKSTVGTDDPILDGIMIYLIR